MDDVKPQNEQPDKLPKADAVQPSAPADLQSTQEAAQTSPTQKKASSSNITDIQEKDVEVSKDTAVSSLKSEQFSDLLLELHRSLDFCQSQLGQAPPSKLILDPMFSRNTELISYLKNQVSMSVETLDLKKLTKTEQTMEDKYQLDCFAVIGAGMTFEETPALQTEQPTPLPKDQPVEKKNETAG